MIARGSRYRKVHTNLWGDRRFMSLSDIQPSGKSLWIYLLTGPETSIIPGVLKGAGKEALAEALRWSVPDLMRCFSEIEREGMAYADWPMRMIYLPNGVAYNPPANPNVVRAWRKEFDTLPEASMIEMIWKNISVSMSQIDAEMLAAGKEGRFLSTWEGAIPRFARNENGGFARQGSGTEQQNMSSTPTPQLPDGLPNRSGEHPSPENSNGSANGLPNGSVATHQPPAAIQPEPEPVGGDNPSVFNGLQMLENGLPNGSANGCPNTEAVDRSSRQEQEQDQDQKDLAGAYAPPCASHRIRDAHPVSQEEEEGEGAFQLTMLEADPDPVFCEFPIVGGGTYRLLESKVQEYEATYPGVDVRQEVRSCRQWDIDNPARRKTQNGILAHISKWIRRKNDDLASRVLYPSPASAQSKMAPAPRQSLAELPEGFQRFWAEYPPGKGDMSEAAQVWAAVYSTAGKETVDQIIAGVAGWKKSEDWAKESGRFIPNPSRFLREERWKAVPANRHFGIDDAGRAKDMARFNGMTLKQIEQARRLEGKSAAISA